MELNHVEEISALPPERCRRKGYFSAPTSLVWDSGRKKLSNVPGSTLMQIHPGKFYNVLNEAIESSFAKTTVSVQLLDANQMPTETNVNITFANSLTGAPMYDFVHYLDRQGKPDTVQIDPVVEYDLIVNTVPAVIKRSVAISVGKHNVINIPAPQGNLIIQQEGRRDNNLQSIIREKGKVEIIQTQPSSQSFRYLTGKYAVETLTLPRRTFDVDIQPNKTQTILLPAPGVVNFNTIATGYGSLYELKDGTQEWVCNLNELKSQFSLTMLPGQYKIVFRVKQTTGSKYTGYKNFTLRQGETLTVNVFN